MPDPWGPAAVLNVDKIPKQLRAVKKEIMKPNAGREYNKILINHWRWLQDQGPSYKQQASSCKLQAASLTRRLYGVIGESRRK